MRVRENITFSIATKDSKKSLNHLKLALDEFIVMGDRANAMHFYEPSERLNNEFRETIMSILMMHLPLADYNLILQRKEKKYVFVDIVELLQAAKSKIFIIGFSDNDLMMAYILEKCPCATVFLKTDTSRNPSFNWLLCVDQSILCVKALKNMKYFIKQGDSLSVVYVRKPGNSETLCERYAEPVNDCVPNYYEIDIENFVVHQAVMSFIARFDRQVHFIVCGAYGEDGEEKGVKRTGTIAKNFVKYSSCNVVVMREFN